MATPKKTQIEKIVKRLASGKNLTVNEALNRFGVQNLRARIHEIRSVFGLPVYTNKVDVRGQSRKATAYRLPVKFSKEALSILTR